MVDSRLPAGSNSVLVHGRHHPIIDRGVERDVNSAAEREHRHILSPSASRPLGAAVCVQSWQDRRMPANSDPRVDAFIDALPAWQQAICREVRVLVHAADPEVVETIKRTDRPYFVLHGNICAFQAAKDHVNVFLYDGAIVPDPAGIITGGHDNKTARTVAVRRGETINSAALGAMFGQIIVNNRAGGWRALKGGG